MFSMKKFRNSAGPFHFFCALVAGSSIFIFIRMLLSPSEPGNSLILGLSLPRLIFACGLLIAFIVSITFLIKAFNNQQWAERMWEQWFGGGRSSISTAWLASIS